MKHKSLIFILLNLLSPLLFAQELLPFVENFGKSNYQGDNHIWSLTQGSDNAMYFANHHYLLRYDGVKWEKNMLPHKTVIRSIMADGNKIYSGSYKEFGYWFRKDGKMHYVSISDGKKVFNEKENEEIWKIFKFNNRIYFQSFSGIFWYNGTHIKKVKLPFLISYCYTINNQLLIATVDKGVYKMTNEHHFQKVKGWSAVENNVIHNIEKYQNNIYVFTRKNGVFVNGNGILNPWDNSLNTILKKANINAARFIKNNKLIIGTAHKGLYIVDLNDGSYKNINRNNGLINNSILSLTLDKEDDLWLGLDNGISHIEVNSPISIFNDNSGVLGSVYSVASTPKGYLMASNHGVFKYEDMKLSLIPNSEGQAWSISKINDKYIIGHDEGIFVYKDDVFSKLHNAHGAGNLTKSNVYNSYLQGTYSGVIIYNKINDLTSKIEVQKLLNPIKHVAQNRKNEIWAADKYRGLYRILYNDAFETTKVENISQRNKITNDYRIKIFEFRNEMLFLIHNNWYTFNAITGQLEENVLFNSNFKNISDIVSIDESRFIVLQEGLLYHIYANGNKFVWNSIPEKYYKGRIINDDVYVYNNKENYIVNLDDGFMSLNIKYGNRPDTKVKIEAFDNDSLLQDRSTIKFNSELKINVISGKYGIAKQDLFYKLHNAKSFIPVKEGLILLNNLNSSSHTITIYGYDGQNYNPISDFNFTVSNPWYFSFWMIVLYIVSIGIILYVYYRWNKMKYIQKLKLKEEELKYQKKILEIELQAEKELNIQEYERHILELELQSKSSEVAVKSLSIAKQSEMIDNIQNILNKDMDLNKIKSEIKKAIKINAFNKHEWETFEANLNQIHNEFIINLSQQYPILTPKDIKLCIYLVMNLSSKEIAPMMNITFRGVDLHRYRLRKKLNLTSEESLFRFLLSVKKS